MNRFLIAIFAVALLSRSLLAQSPQSPSRGSMSAEQQAAPAGQTAPPSTPAPAPTADAAKTSRIAPGSVLPVELTKTIDAKKAKKGDEVIAKVTQDMQGNDGSVVVPKDTKIVGHVTEVEARSKEQKESQLAIVFDHAVLKGGEQMLVPMSIQAIIAPPNRNPGPEPSSSYPSSPAGGAPVGGGARTGSMGGNYPAQNAPQTPAAGPTESPTNTPAQPPITGNTQGVVGISNLKLSAAADASQGSLVSSEKSNVKLESGTFLLLRVNE